MRTFIIVSFIFLAAFGMPDMTLATADTGPAVVAPLPIDTGAAKVAPPSSSNPATQLINPLKGAGTLQSFLASILSLVVQLGTIAIILMLVFVGYKFVAAQGAPAKIEEAKKMLLYTIIGALILLGAQAISLAVQSTVTSLGG